MAEVLRASKMTHAGRELGLHPLSIRKSQFRNWAAFELARLQAGAQLVSLNAGKGNEGRACICQSLTWGRVAELCAYSCQVDNLLLKAWETPPCHADEKDFSPDPECSPARNAEACALLRRMLAAGVSRWHPDPMKALEHAERKKARRRRAR